MIDHRAVQTPTDDSVASIQSLEDGTPRFRIPRSGSLGHWRAAVAAEMVGGVHPEIRCFLDAQLETGDVVLDVGSKFAFVALSAATTPDAMASVLFMHEDQALRLEVQQAALAAGRWVDVAETDDWAVVRELLDQRLNRTGRLLVHTSADRLADTCLSLAQLVSDQRVLAICVSDARDHEDRVAITGTLQAIGFVACQLVAQGEEPMLVRTDVWESGDIVALPASVLDGEPAEPDSRATAPSEQLHALLETDHAPNDEDSDALTIFMPGASAIPTHSTPAAVATGHAPSTLATPVAAAAAEPAAAKPVVSGDARAAGLSLIAPHSRTGYGVVGANLLRALQARDVPIAFFPVGPVDPSLTDNPRLIEALDAQSHFAHEAPSVRLFQALDLALHAGRGPRIGFPIFEATRFSERELHHLRSQDALLVCTPWARGVLADNGLAHVPTHIVPLGVDRAVFHEQVTPAQRSAETVFLQVGKLEPRKGQLALLRAFEAAFAPSDPVRLVIACYNPFVTDAAFREALEPFRRSPMARRITLITQPLATSADVAALMASADCGVFAVRAEGWNLEALEMLSLGKTMIATNVTGHTGFLTAENARLIAPTTRESAASAGMLGDWCGWTETEHEVLVEHLRAVHVARRTGPLPVNQAGIDTARAHSWDRSAVALLQAIATL